MSRIFISHSSRDDPRAVQLRDWLQSNGWDDVFLDLDPVRGLAPGERWQNALKAAADRCEAVLCIITENWLNSRWCLSEYLLAKQLGKRLFPVIFGDVGISALPADMAIDHQAVDVAHDSQGWERLKQGLKRAGLDANSFSFPAGRRPYPGLEPLTEEDAAIFFGRDAQVLRGLDRLRLMRDAGAERVLVVLGASGAGKSSFLRAGLWPRLRRDDRNFWPLPVIRPGRAVLTDRAGLYAALEGALGDRRLSRDSAVASFPRSRAALGETVARGGLAELFLALRLAAAVPLSDEQSSQPTLVLCVDQAEELLDEEGREEAGRFLELLAQAIEAERHLLVVICVRSDSYPRLQADPRIAGIAREPFDLPPMPEGSLRSVIEGPARLAVPPLKLEPAFVDALLEDATGQDALPLLAFTLGRLAREHGADGVVSLQDYQSLGGIRGAIIAAVDEALVQGRDRGLAPKDQKSLETLLRQAFVPHLARVNEAGEFARRVATADEIPPAAKALIELMVEARLLVRDRSGQSEVIEVAHEALLREWPLLRNFLEADREFLTGKRQLADDLAIWQAAPPESKSDALLSGLRLTRAQHWLTERASHDLTQAERTFIGDSVRVAAARQRWRTRVAAIVILLLAGFSAVAMWQWMRAKEAAAVADQNAAEARAEKTRADQSAADARRNADEAQAQKREAQEQRDSATKAQHEAERERNVAQNNFDIAKNGADDLAFNLAANIPSLQNRRTEAVLKPLESAQSLIDQLATAKPDDPQVQQSKFRISSQLIPPYLAILKLASARIAAERCLELVPLLGQNSELGTCLEYAGDARLATNDPRGAIMAYRQFLDNSAKIIREEDVALQEQIDKEEETRNAYPTYRPRLLNLVYRHVRDSMRLSIKLADATLAAGDQAGAIVIYNSVLTNPYLYEHYYNHMEGWALVGLGKLYLSAGSLPEARKSFEAGLVLARKALSSSENQNDNYEIEDVIGSALEGLGDVQSASANSSVAIKSYEESRASRARTTKPDPSNYERAYWLSQVMTKLGNAYFQIKDYNKSAQSFIESLENSGKFVTKVDDVRVGDLVRRTFDGIENIRNAAGDKPIAEYAPGADILRSLLPIIDTLIKIEPGNVRWQVVRLTVLSASDDLKALSIAEVLKRDGVFPDSRKGLFKKIHDAVPPEDRGEVYYKMQEYDRAIADYSQAITLHKDKKKGWLYGRRADAYFKKGDYDKAITDYNQMSTLVLDSNRPFIFRAYAYSAKGDHDSAIVAYSDLLKRGGTSFGDAASFYKERGRSWSAKRDYDRAIADYDDAIRVGLQADGNANWELAWAYNSRGVAWDDKGDYDRAIADYNLAIQLTARYEGTYQSTYLTREVPWKLLLAWAYNNRGIAWRHKGDYSRAIADYDEAIRLTPEFWLAYANRGVAWNGKGDHNRAIADYDEAIKLNPKRAHAYRLRAVSKLYSGLLSEALADLDHASEIDPKDPYTALWLDIVNKRSNLASRLPQSITQVDMTKWPAPVIRLFLGQLTTADVLAAATTSDVIKMTGQICEANFFNGELALDESAKEEAARLFRLAAVDCPKNLLEWAEGNAELKELGKVVPY
jgi:tetratricopeptide (TPR) repeat protein